jgi:hypothetical protein
VNREEGPEWLAENYGLPIETVRTRLSFYKDMKAGAVYPA